MIIISSSNKTTNYQLNQFTGSDHFDPVADYNADMLAVDTAIKSVKDNADSKTPLDRTIAGFPLSSDITLSQLTGGGGIAAGDGNGNALNALKLGGSDAANFPQFSTGTWTPTLYGATTAGTVTLTEATGIYYKIGRIVFVSAWIVWSAISGGSGEIRVGALPFTSGDARSDLLTISTASITNMQSFGFIVAEIRPFGNAFNIWTAIGAPDFSTLVSTGGWIGISGSYLAVS